jgi:hypothetical protein
MPDEPRATLGEPLIGHLGQEGFGRRLDRLGRREGDNGAILVHGASLRLAVLAGWLPASMRHPPQTLVTQSPP